MAKDRVTVWPNEPRQCGADAAPGQQLGGFVSADKVFDGSAGCLSQLHVHVGAALLPAGNPLAQFIITGLTENTPRSHAATSAAARGLSTTRDRPAVCVRVDGTQRFDGAKLEREVILDDVQRTVDRARQPAAMLIEAADVMDGWTDRHP